jgi:tRNA threonylcarbamoyladenosine biosynthesis protein TsaE
MIALTSQAATEALGEALAREVRAGDVIALSGTLGAGKTTLARGLLRGLGFTGEVASPTFPIVLAYDPPDVRLPLWHVDLYRTETPSEIEQLGLDDALADAALLIEWPERLGDRLWPEALALALEIVGPDARSLTAKVPAAWESRWPPS